jgi:asparaginyl-tRNA synthetase
MPKVQLKIDGKKVVVDYKDHFATVARVNDSLRRGSFAQYQKSKLTYVDVPQIVGITGACENVDTLFKVGNRLDLPLFFTQTGQLALEQALQSFPGVFTVIHSGRDEEEEDERHLRQFRLTEEEFDSTMLGMERDNYDEEKMFEAMLKHIQSAIQAMITQVVEDHELILQRVYGRKLAVLKQAATTPFYRISYEDAVKKLQKSGFEEVEFGDDLKADHEAKIVELMNKKGEEIPVFIMKYPKEIKFFNMKVSAADSRVVLSADLILPRAGESVGSSVREHDFERLNERLINSTMFRLHLERGGKYEDFLWYLNIIKGKGTQPHAGYGIGNERVLQYIFGVQDIRTISLFSLLNLQSKDWDKSRYGQSSLQVGDKKNILLTIGQTADKKAMLPYIKKLARKKPEYVLYATQHTHEFLETHGVRTALVHKISKVGQTPNISDLLRKRMFDLVINIPRRTKVKTSKEFTDGKLIRKAAISLGVNLITDLEVACELINNLVGDSEE